MKHKCSLLIVVTLALCGVQCKAPKVDKKIVIVGAGASGVAAAVKLVSNGFKDVTILEAENRLGGRVNTVPFGDNVIDIGAQWFVDFFLFSFLFVA